MDVNVLRVHTLCTCSCLMLCGRRVAINRPLNPQHGTTSFKLMPAPFMRVRSSTLPNSYTATLTHRSAVSDASRSSALSILEIEFLNARFENMNEGCRGGRCATYDTTAAREKERMGSDRRVTGAYLDARFYWFPSCSLWHRSKFLCLLKTGTILPFVQRSIHRPEPTDDDELWTCGFEG